MPKWLKKQDEGIWEKAKKAALEACNQSDPKFLDVVKAVFAKLGGALPKGADEVVRCEDEAVADEEAKKVAEEAIKAAGTSEGAKKGWEGRSGNPLTSHAIERSKIANDHSWSSFDMESRGKTITSHTHNFSGQLHDKAASAHMDAAFSASQDGDNDSAKAHMKESMHHRKEAGHQYEQAFKKHDPKVQSPLYTTSEVGIYHGSEKVNFDIIHCRARQSFSDGEPAKAWEVGKPVEFMFMPAGTHVVNAGFRKGSIKLAVKCDAATAKAVEEDLVRHRKEQPDQEPYGCTDHDEKAASVRVKADCGVNWKDGKGVYIKAYPTALGVGNVNGELHRSWSPSFTTDADYSKCECERCDEKADKCECGESSCLTFPDGVRGSESNPAEITGVDFCVGTLTNKPAFRKMAPVKGSEKVSANAPQGNQNAAGSHKVGGFVKLKKPGLNGPVNIAGTVKQLLPNGKIEVETQQDGYFVIHHSEATKATEPTSVDAIYADQAAALAQANEIALAMGFEPYESDEAKLKRIYAEHVTVVAEEKESGEEKLKKIFDEYKLVNG